ncbi:adhesin [Lentzea sp. NBRC 105346]|uniref:ScbA/BarX family gamma-butyrolactone biosynthesis protein n=1 Tax=Lentzea sp. NBRC 105346 TaxID=3032205 RepID=UPI0024A46C9D|nr:ScbA/BarX family gamma-butyrolactone biosynthesis protein [Lentzea sp. NBRC 105346]GLZ32270.1 adhesin [Lentzea sp. NBRC 105346]
MTALLPLATRELTTDTPWQDDFQQTVPRRLVHRAAVAEVLPTHWHRLSEDTFAVGAMWPRQHSFYEPIAGHHDPMILAETIRQAGLLVAHVGYDIKLDAPFIMWELAHNVDLTGLIIEDAPAKITVEVIGRDVSRRGSSIVDITFDMRIFRGFEQIGTGLGKLSSVSKGVYARLRKGQVNTTQHCAVPGVEPIEPAVVGRYRPNDVVLGATGEPDTWRLRVPSDHPVLFDHAVDHVPGMLLLEAARQAVQQLNGPGRVVPLAMSSEFHRFAELNEPTTIRAERLGQAVTRVVAEQAGKPVATTLVTAKTI